MCFLYTLLCCGWDSANKKLPLLRLLNYTKHCTGGEQKADGERKNCGFPVLSGTAILGTGLPVRALYSNCSPFPIAGSSHNSHWRLQQPDSGQLRSLSHSSRFTPPHFQLLTHILLPFCFVSVLVEKHLPEVPVYALIHSFLNFKLFFNGARFVVHC